MITSSALSQSRKSQAKSATDANTPEANKSLMSKKQSTLVKRILVSAVLFALLFWITLALLSFDASDVGWSHITSSANDVTNLMGGSGALVADVLLTMLGYAAWIVPIVLVRELINQWWSGDRVGGVFRILAGIFCLLGAASFLAIAFKLFGLGGSLDTNFLAGGVLGTEIALGLTDMVGLTAGCAIAALVFVFTFTFAFDVKWRSVALSLSRLLDNKVDLEQYKKTVALKESTQTQTQTHGAESQITGSMQAPLSNAALSANTVDRTLTASKGVSTTKEISDFLKNKLHERPSTQACTQGAQVAGAATKSAVSDSVAQSVTVESTPTEFASLHTESPTAPSSTPIDMVANKPASIVSKTATALTTQKSALTQQAKPKDESQLDLLNYAEEVPAIDVRFRAADDMTGGDLVPDADVHEITDVDLHGVKEEQPNEGLSTVVEQMPNITNVGRSRAFATAEHRASLTPIPSIELLDKPDLSKRNNFTPEELTRLSELLEIKLGEFNVEATVADAQPGPVVTRFEVDLAAGVKASKVTNISRDLARSLSMPSLRVVEVIPGKPYIGIEIPNETREMVRLSELLDTKAFADPNAGLSMAIGKDISGKVMVTDLAKAPHLLVAGTTGSGKSVAVNTMLLSMLLKYTPDELRLILIDPKQLELANYSDIPHLLTPVVTDMKDAASALNWCVQEMERRYKLMAFLKVRKLSDYNKKLSQADKRGEDFLDPLWRPNDDVSTDRAPRLKPLPAIVVIADEFADMIMQVGKQAEELITRLAQKSRAAGIHLILATQRPSVDVITGLIKANIPTRMALRVNSKVDSRTILDQGGAEDMLGNGDMLFLGPGKIEPERAHGAFVSDDEVNTVCDAWRERGSPDYVEDMLNSFDETAMGSSEGGGGSVSGETDSLYDEAVAFIMETRKVSASSIQRKFSIGYNRAARIVDAMEEAGIVSSMDKGGKREILM